MTAEAMDHMGAAAPRRGRVVTADALQARAEDREIKAKADEIFEEARRQGYAAGKEEAATEAIEMIARLRIDTERWTRAIETEMIEMVMRSVGRVIGEMDDIELVQRVAAVALAELRDVGRVSLHVAPKDHAAVRDHIAILAQAFPQVVIVDVAPDRDVEPGGAILKSAIGSVDARLSTQLDGLRRALSSAFAPAEEDEDGDGAEAAA